MIAHIRALDLVAILGNQQNVHELSEMLTKIEVTNFSSLPSVWSARGQGHSAAPGLSGPGADFVWYDPCDRRFISLEEARWLARSPRISVLVDHPVGWYYSDFSDGYTLPPGGHVVRVGRERCAGTGWGVGMPIDAIEADH